MASSHFWVYIAFILLLVIVLWYLEHIRKFWHGLFSNKPREKQELMCPKCGSRSWKYANPLKPSESMINMYHLVNQLSECEDCGYIGIFYSSDKIALRGLKPKSGKRRVKRTLTKTE